MQKRRLKVKNKLMVIPLVISFLSLALGRAAEAEDCQLPSGKTWKNELKSEMTVKVDPSGALSGTYKTAEGCGSGIPRPLTGFCNGYAVTFSVNWQECMSTTAWSGTYSSGKLTTLWQLVLAKQPAWDSIMAGTDTFSTK
jgi:hypothetical protein